MIKEGELALKRQEFEFNQGKANTRSSSPLVVAILAGLVAALASIYSSYLSGKNALDVEKAKDDIARKTSDAKTLGSAVGELAKPLTRGLQEGAWIMWIARNDPNSLTPRAIASYDASMKELLPATTSALTLVATLNEPTYLAVKSVVDEFTTLDGRIARFLLLHRKDPCNIAVRYELQALHDEVMKANSEVGSKMASAYLNKAIARPPVKFDMRSTTVPDIQWADMCVQPTKKHVAKKSRRPARAGSLSAPSGSQPQQMQEDRNRRIQDPPPSEPVTPAFVPRPFKEDPFNVPAIIKRAQREPYSPLCRGCA